MSKSVKQMSMNDVFSGILKELSASKRSSFASALDQLRKVDSCVFECDLSFLGNSLAKMFCSADPFIQIHSIDFCIYFMPTSYNGFNNCTNIFSLLLKKDIFINKTLRLLIHLENVYLVKSLINDIRNVYLNSNCLVSKNVLVLLFTIWKKNKMFQEELVKKCKECIYDQEMRLLGIEILLEIKPSLSDDEAMLLKSLISVNCNIHLFSKIILLLANCCSDKIFDLLLEESDMFLKNINYCCTYLSILNRLKDKTEFKKKLAENIQNYIRLTNDTSLKKYLTIKLMEIDQNLNYDDPFNEDIEFEMKSFILDIDDISKVRMLIQDNIKYIFTEKMYFIVEMIIKKNFVHDDWFYNFIFDVYNLHTQISFYTAKHLLETIVTDDDKNNFLNYVRIKLKRMKDDDFCRAIASMIVEVSNRPEDILLLLPDDLSIHPKEFQSFLISCSTLFWLKKRFCVDNGIMHRLNGFLYSSYREIRIKISQLLDLVKSIE